MEKVRIKKILARNLLIYIGFHCFNSSSWSATTLATLPMVLIHIKNFLIQWVNLSSCQKSVNSWFDKWTSPEFFSCRLDYQDCYLDYGTFQALETTSWFLLCLFQSDQCFSPLHEYFSNFRVVFVTTSARMRVNFFVRRFDEFL